MAVGGNRALFLALLTAGVGGACSAFSGAPAVGVPDATAPEATADARLDAALDAGGPFNTMVVVATAGENFFIDPREVTVADFTAFLATSPKPTGPAACTSKSALGKGRDGPTCTKRLAQPVTCVDWCDAYAYCSAAKKRLCGDIAGSPATDIASGATNEWTRACAGAVDGKVYGNGAATPNPPCNVADPGAGQPADVGAFPSCQRPNSGLFDMSGNVAEWSGTCNPIGSQCSVRGGSFLSDAMETRCDMGKNVSVSAVAPDIGFRCCASAR